MSERLALSEVLSIRSIAVYPKFRIYYQTLQLKLEWVYWCNDRGVSYPKPEEVNSQAVKTKEQAGAIALQERQQKEKLAAYLRFLVIIPDEI